MDSASMPRSRGVDRVLLTVALAAHGLVWLFATRPVALDPDPMNLAYGMYRFDITHFNPHAPGYLIYVWTLKAVHLLTGGGAALLERFATVQLVALLFALAAIFTVYAAARRLKLVTGAAGWAALVIALHPILVFHSVDAQTHTSEAFASALLLWGAIFYRERPGWRRALWLGLFLAFGSALRPSFVIFGVPVIVWTIGFRRFAYLAVAGLASVVGAIGWIAPTVYASGGWEIWRTATRRLVHGRFVLTSSPFSDTAVASLVSANQMSLALWTLET
ncbi:MAG: glycosyltransferase family 39 protein, partial [Deltaproteobacteria bacterium]|nr:glycosyltransferase family 39 protein [Deltaproteobacteria bacterium]